MDKKILELCLSPDLGGLELCVADFYDYFKSQGESYICVAEGKKLDSFIADENKLTLKYSKFFPFMAAFRLAQFIDSKKIDVIHFHWTKDMLTVVLAKLLTKRGVNIIQSRHMSMTRFKNDFYHKWLYRNINIIHAVTQQVKVELEQFIPEKVRPCLEMIYLGVKEPQVNMQRVEEFKERYKIGKNFVVGIVGRIEEQKGQYLLLKAVAKLPSSGYKVLIVGAAMSEKYLETLKSLSRELGIEDKVIWSGFTKEVNEYIALCDVTVLATPKETFGLVVIESMVNGVPVIATKNGGPLEIIDDGLDGLLFLRNSEALATKIELLFNDEVLKKSIASAAYKKVKEKFDREKQMNRIGEVIDEYSK